MSDRSAVIGGVAAFALCAALVIWLAIPVPGGARARPRASAAPTPLAPAASPEAPAPAASAPTPIAPTPAAPASAPSPMTPPWKGTGVVWPMGRFRARYYGVAQATFNGYYVMLGPPDGPLLEPDGLSAMPRDKAGLRGYVLIPWEKLVPWNQVETFQYEYRPGGRYQDFQAAGLTIPASAPGTVPSWLTGPPPPTPFVVIVTIATTGFKCANTVERE
jgi:hypothetical protein